MLPGVCEGGGVAIAPAFEEIIVATTQLVPHQELHIRRAVTTHQAFEPVELRCQYAATEFLASSPRHLRLQQ